MTFVMVYKMMICSATPAKKAEMKREKEDHPEKAHQKNRINI